jgi:hypothetical protein
MPTSVKVLIGAILAALVGVSVLYFVKAPGSSNEPVSTVIESITPANGDKTLQNGQISIDLLTGWDARLTVDGKTIPDDQLKKVPQQGTIVFNPGPGKELEYFPAGQNCVVMTYWQIATGPENSFTKSWCFTSF